MFKLISNCRACGCADLETVLPLGNQYVVDFVSHKDEAPKGKAPLELVICPNCFLVQLHHSVDADSMYRHFWYRSGINEMMRKALEDVVSQVSLLGKIGPGDAVCDIGCNDGTLLGMYGKGVLRVGFDPAANVIQEAAEAHRLECPVAEYFNADDAQKVLSQLNREGFKAITAIAMFYDLEDPTKFLQDVKRVLASNGVFVVQMNYLKGMLEQNAFDNISHEHLTYFTLASFKYLAERCGLQVIDAETNDVNGGSFRVYCSHIGTKFRNSEKGQKRIEKMLLDEQEAGLQDLQTYSNFRHRVSEILSELRMSLLDYVEQGKKVYLYGASTRGSTLLQALGGLNNEGDLSSHILGAAERDPNKYGLLTVGTWIPIKSEEECRKDADVFFVLPWHFFKGILAREIDWMANGGQFVVPLPSPRSVDSLGIEYLGKIHSTAGVS